MESKNKGDAGGENVSDNLEHKNECLNERREEPYDGIDHLVMQLQDACIQPDKPHNHKLNEIVVSIKAGKIKNIITMVGAGISTAAGIPDFRSERTGLYDNLSEFDIPYPQAIFELGYFVENPKPFFKLMKKLIPVTSARPTKAHYFIKLLDSKKLLLRHYTQNIDNLDYEAGISEDKIVEAHGSFRKCSCIDCGESYNFEKLKDDVLNDIIPRCKKCKGVIKPGIVFFGECLPLEFFLHSEEDFKKCDLLIIMGSSLTVKPFSSLCGMVRPSCPRILINKKYVGREEGLKCHMKNNGRDIAMLGSCDEMCEQLVQKLGWGDDWTALCGTSK